MLKYRRAEKGNPMFLEIKNLTVKMGGQKLLDDVSFNVEKGDRSEEHTSELQSH